MKPDSASAPASIGLGALSPVIADVSKDPEPSTTVPSTGTRSPGRTSTRSPGSTSSGPQSTHSSPRRTRALSGRIASSDRMERRLLSAAPSCIISPIL
jgi:hypothetical protein